MKLKKKIIIRRYQRNRTIFSELEKIDNILTNIILLLTVYKK